MGKAERDALREKAVQAVTLGQTWAGMRYQREGNFELITNLAMDQRKKPQPRSTTPVLIGAPSPSSCASLDYSPCQRWFGSTANMAP